jgi:hypothetical protein
MAVHLSTAFATLPSRTPPKGVSYLGKRPNILVSGVFNFLAVVEAIIARKLKKVIQENLKTY